MVQHAICLFVRHNLFVVGGCAFAIICLTGVFYFNMRMNTFTPIISPFIVLYRPCVVF